MRSLLCIFLFTFFTSHLLAQPGYTCPSIDNVHHLQNIWPNGPWLPLYVINEELASMNDIANFSKQASAFLRAEWSWDFLEAGHCFYAGNSQIVLARNMLKPNIEDFPQWQKVTEKSFICRAWREEQCSYSGSG